MKRAISQEFSFWQLLAFSVPAVAMLVVSSLYTAVDGVFVSRFVGSDGLSAINIVLPLDTLAFGVGIMFGTGTSAIVGRKLGQGEAKAADEDLTLATLAAGVLGAVLSVLGLVFLEPLVRLLGASDRLLPYCVEYGRVLFASAFFTVIQVMYQALFITAGRGRIALWLTVASGVLNLVLDWLLIGVLGMGMTGAALGTVSGRVLGGLFPLFYFLKERGTLRFRRPRWDPGMLALAMGNGSSEMVSNLAISVTTLLFNLSMLALAGEDGLAAMTIVLYAQFVYTAVSMGFATSAAPVISYHFGSGNTRYLQRLFRHCLGAIVLVTAAMMASAMLFARPLIALFTPPGGAVFDLALHGFWIFLWNFLFAGFNIFSSSLFTALSNGAVSALISFLRTLVFVVGSILLLPRLLGLDGIWLAIPVAEGLTFLIAAALVIRFGREPYHYLR